MLVDHSKCVGCGNCVAVCPMGAIHVENKVATIKKNLKEEGIATDDELDKVDMPVGIGIHAVTADEIAISIVAGLIREKNK